MSEGPTGTVGAPDPEQPPTPAPSAPRPAPRWGQYAPQDAPPPTPGPASSPPGPGPWGGSPGPGQWGAPPGPGQWGAPAGYGQYGQYGPTTPVGYGPSPWAPVPLAPRPGIIPLRPLSLGEIFDGAFRAIRTNPRVMFGLSAIVVTITAVLQGLVTWRLFAAIEPTLTSTTATAADGLEELDAMVGELVSQLGLLVGAQVISFVVTTILSGLLIVSVSQSVIGRTASPGEVWASARRQVWRLLGLTLLVLVVIAAPVVVWGGLTVAAMVNEQWGLAVVLALLGGLGTLVAVMVLVTRTLLATPALMLERAGIVESVRRGWLLTRRGFWRVLGIYLLTSLIVAVVAGSITNGASLVLQFAATDPASALLSPAYLIGTTLAQIVATTLTTPFTAGVTALLYIDVRMRTEGLDIELARAAEATD